MSDFMALHEIYPLTNWNYTNYAVLNAGTLPSAETQFSTLQALMMQAYFDDGSINKIDASAHLPLAQM